MAAVTIPSARQPDTMLLFGAFLVYCTLALATDAPVGDLSRLWRTVLLGAIALGSSMVLAAAWRNTVYTLVRFEQPGRLLLAGTLLIYSGWQVKAGNPAGLVIAAPLGISSLIRLWEIKRYIRVAHHRED